MNGAGKTTTFNMITSTISPSKGVAMLNGRVSVYFYLHQHLFLKSAGKVPTNGYGLMELLYTLLFLLIKRP